MAVGPAEGLDPLAALVPFSKSLPLTLLRAREAMMSRIRPMLRRHGLTEQQWRVIRTLGACDECEVTQLAERTFLLPPSLSRILADLHAQGLIERRTAPNDHRRGLVSISPTGEAVIAKVAPDAAPIAEEVRRRFGEAKLAQLHGLLLELEEVLGADED